MSFSLHLIPQCLRWMQKVVMREPIMYRMLPFHDFYKESQYLGFAFVSKTQRRLSWLGPAETLVTFPKILLTSQCLMPTESKLQFEAQITTAVRHCACFNRCASVLRCRWFQLLHIWAHNSFCESQDTSSSGFGRLLLFGICRILWKGKGKVISVLN